MGFFVKKNGKFLENELFMQENQNKVYVICRDILYVLDENRRRFLVFGSFVKSEVAFDVLECAEACYFGSCRSKSGRIRDVYYYQDKAWMLDRQLSREMAIRCMSYMKIDSSYEICADGYIKKLDNYVYTDSDLFDMNCDKFVYKDVYVVSHVVTEAIQAGKVDVLKVLVELYRTNDSVSGLSLSAILHGRSRRTFDQIEQRLRFAGLLKS